MFTLTVLGSGSGGNCSLVATDHCRVLIDAGFSARQIEKRLEAIGLSADRLDAIVLTHEHGDHIAGLTMLSRRYQVPVYTNRFTAEALLRSGVALGQPCLFETGACFAIKDLEIQTFYVPHDAVDPVAFVFRHTQGSIGFLTDLGYAPKLAVSRLREVQTLVIETNHDERMLQDDLRRPWCVKQRILSRHGHLSNSAAAHLVAEIAGDRLQRVVLGHLSRDCNTPELALSAMASLGLDRLELFCAEQHLVSPTFVVQSSSPPNEQVGPVCQDQSSTEYAQSFFDWIWQAI